MGRLRIFLIAAILIVIIALVIVVVLPQLNQPAPTAETDTTTQQQVAQAPQSTPLPTATPIIFVDLVIAVQELPRGIVIPPNAVAIRPWPQDAAPINAITNMEDVIGKRARTDIFREQPILSNMVVDDLTGAAHVGSDAAAVLPNGLRAVSIPVDRLTSIAYAPQDGDRVDLIISMLFVDVDEAFQSLVPNDITLIKVTEDGIVMGQKINGRVDSTGLGQAIISPSENPRPRLVTQMTIQDALIIHIGQLPERWAFHRRTADANAGSGRGSRSGQRHAAAADPDAAAPGHHHAGRYAAGSGRPDVVHRGKSAGHARAAFGKRYCPRCRPPRSRSTT